MTWRSRSLADQRGSASIELVLLTPVLLVLLLLVVAGGRLAGARGAVDAAARDAARAGTIARSPGDARRDALAAAAARLDEGSVGCRDLTVDVDASDFRAGGSVAVTVTCSVDLGDLTLLRVPGARDITSHAVEPVDAFRGTRP
jgi:Flp pilus assembly protein TadG